LENKPHIVKETAATVSETLRKLVDKTEEESILSKFKSSLILFASMIALKINESILFNPAINAQPNQNSNLTNNSTVIVFAGLFAVAIIFIIFYQKVLRNQKGKETDIPENKSIKTSNNRKRNETNRAKGIKEKL
jgi:amino acid permease